MIFKEYYEFICEAQAIQVIRDGKKVWIVSDDKYAIDPETVDPKNPNKRPSVILKSVLKLRAKKSPSQLMAAQ